MNAPSNARQCLINPFYLNAIDCLERGDGGWQHVESMAVVPGTSGGNGEPGHKPFLQEITVSTAGPVAVAACPHCGESATVASLSFETTLCGGGPIVPYRSAVAVCDVCQHLSVLAEAVHRGGSWRPVLVGFVPARPEEER